MRRVHVLSSGAQGFSAKLAPKYESPYKVLERKSPTVYVLEMKDGRTNPKVHIDELKKYVAPEGLKNRESNRKQGVMMVITYYSVVIQTFVLSRVHVSHWSSM